MLISRNSQNAAFCDLANLFDEVNTERFKLKKQMLLQCDYFFNILSYKKTTFAQKMMTVSFALHTKISTLSNQN